MNWKAVGWALLVSGVITAIAGFAWHNSAHGRAYDCRIQNIYFELNAPMLVKQCPSGTPGWIMFAIGAAAVVIAICLLVGAAGRRPAAR